jgi:hypothetical protein
VLVALKGFGEAALGALAVCAVASCGHVAPTLAQPTVVTTSNERVDAEAGTAQPADAAPRVIEETGDRPIADDSPAKQAPPEAFVVRAVKDKVVDGGILFLVNVHQRAYITQAWTGVFILNRDIPNSKFVVKSEGTGIINCFLSTDKHDLPSPFVRLMPPSP